MIHLSPGKMIVIGFIMLVVGVALPFVMVLRLVEPTLFLGFVSYLMSLFGLILGLLGVLQYGTARRRRDNDGER